MKILYLTVDLLESIAKKEVRLDIEMYLELYLENNYNFQFFKSQSLNK